MQLKSRGSGLLSQLNEIRQDIEIFLQYFGFVNSIVLIFEFPLVRMDMNLGSGWLGELSMIESVVK